MNEPKIDFKKVKTFRGMEGYGINADVYINGVKCLFIMDSGDGGEINIEENIVGNSELVSNNIKLLNDYIAQLPKKKWNIGGKIKYENVTLEDYLNDKIAEWAEEKEKKAIEVKKQKLFSTCIVIGVPNAKTYQFINFKRPLDKLPEMWLKLQIDNVQKKYCTNGIEILNTNLSHVMS
jgi:hypothetical protein